MRTRCSISQQDPARTLTTSRHAERPPRPQPGRDSATLVPSIFSFCLQLTSIHRGICVRTAAISPFMLWFSVPHSFTPPSLSHLLSVTDCKLFGINVLKAGFVFMQMFSELDATFLSFGKELPCGQQLGIRSYAGMMVKLWYLRTSVCDYSLYGGRWTFSNIYLSRLVIEINVFSNVCMIDVTISLFILFPD